jgi:NAD(P)H-hydrate epimerase
VKNSPKLWSDKFPKLTREGNKYSRGHALVVGGGEYSTGAARLGAISALRAGAGLVTVISPKDAALVYAHHLTAVMLKSIDSAKAFAKYISDSRITSILIGPGTGVEKRTKDFVLEALKKDKNLVIDADAITVHSSKPSQLFHDMHYSKGQIVLTPHEGEFARLFKRSKDKSVRAKIDDVVAAAKESGAVILLKGADTVIANPEGKFVVSEDSPPTLATAGSGDVLAGIITGLMAQGMDGFNAACAGAWIHAQAAKQFGKGLIAEDLPGLIPSVLDKIIDK